MKDISLFDLQSSYNSINTLLQQSVVDDIEGAFPKTILTFLKNIWLQLAGKRTSKIFATYHEALWVSHSTILKLDPEAGVFGKRIRARDGESELLFAFFKNVIAQFKFSPFFPDSVKGDMQIVPIKLDDVKSERIMYGVTDLFNLSVEGNLPIEFLVYMGLGRSLRDLRRMVEVNADIRALKDMFGFLADDSSNIFPLIHYQKIEDHKDHVSLTIKKNILDEIYQVKTTMRGIRGKYPQGLKIQKDKDPRVFSYFVLDEVESHLRKSDKGWDLLNEIAQKEPKWFEKRQVRLRHFARNGEEITVVPLPEGYKPCTVPLQYKRYLDSYKKDIVIIEILVPVYKIIIPASGIRFGIDIEFTVNTTKGRYRPRPIKLFNIFNKDTLECIHLLQDAKSVENLAAEKIRSLLNMLEVAYRSVTFLIMDNTVVAGAFNYLSYFGRDTVFTHLLLKPFLHIFAQKKMIQQLLNRSNREGEAAHEIDSRVSRGKEDHYDYRMRDTDFLMAISTFELLNEMDNEEMKTFLNYRDINNRYNIISLRPDTLLDNASVIFRNLENILTIIDRNNLVSLKREDDPSSANWRDAVNSFSRGTYPYDVNVVWIPHLLHLLKSFRNDIKKCNILFHFLIRTKLSSPGEHFDQITSFFLSGKEEIEKKTREWVNRTKKMFLNNILIRRVADTIEKFLP